MNMVKASGFSIEPTITYFELERALKSKGWDLTPTFIEIPSWINRKTPKNLAKI